MEGLTAYLVCIAVAAALYAAYAQHDARKAARRASDAARVAEDAATTARAVANREAFDRLGVRR